MYKASPRILMISAQYIPEVYGGAVRQCHKLSQQLIHEGCTITVLTSRKSYSVPHKETIDNINIVRVWTGKPPQLMGKYIFSSLLWLVGSAIWFAKHQKEFDVLHIHQAKFQAFLGAFLGKRYNKPTVAKVGNADFAFDLDSLKRKSLFGNYLYNTVKKNILIFVAISKQISKNFKDHGVHNARVVNIPNGVYQTCSYDYIEKNKSSFRKKLFQSDEKNRTLKYFLSAGRLSEEKNIPLLVGAFAEALRENQNIRLVILGNGPQKKEIESLIKQNQIESKVILTGYVKNVTDYLIAADFFVLPSEVEGMSNSLLEAMSLAVIPIATNISGSCDLIENKKNGFLIDKPWKINLRDTITLCANLNDACIKKMQNESFDTVKRKYTMEKIAKQYIDLYNTLLGV